MSLNKEELLELKDKVGEAKTTVSELTGQQTAILKQLKDDYGCETVEEAKVKLKEMSKNIDTLDRKIAKGVEELEEKYEIDE